MQFEQHAGKKPLHPMSILARSYRGEAFGTALKAGQLPIVDEEKDP
jgi:hypothetical protein